MNEDIEHTCQFCYYEYFDGRAYPCSMCVCGEERKDMFQPKGKLSKRKEETETKTETQNLNLTFEKRTMRDCYNCKRYETEEECVECHYKPKDEPQTEVCDRPQMDCSLCWKESHCRAIKEAERSSE